ncbi:helix-turn-helix domain-containing protein [Virgibacillus sp. NKC19-3]|uniref:BglG family transcription antiterminator n=1 Tax=Virgibacillus saliphilus TaxID=2831674 RepID=UPI001C9A5828|nr:helix-turn-helix domain-containing protein [Virgibacillus sp. NKC19-3]MBY7141990.1 helix-turn-helix domain-containing protein [Virgibacillus sp. NKC19-3]
MFSKRQKIILSYILYTNMPIKLDLLADMMQVSIRTVRAELENINSILSKRNAQVQISKKGQCSIKEEKKETIKKLFVNPIFVDKNNNENHVIWDRIYMIMGLLSFESDYVSMEELAEKLYVSKSTINLDITEIKKIISRIAGIRFIVSSTKGLKFEGSEEDFRYFLAKMIVQGLNVEMTLRYLFPEEHFGISETYSNMNNILKEIMVKHQFIISGKAFGLVSATLFITAVRNQLGYGITRHRPGESLLPIMKELEKRLKAEVDIAFTKADMIYIQQFIMEQNHLSPYTNEEWNLVDRQIVSLFTYVIKDFFQIDLMKYPNFETDFTFYINQLNQRMKNGHDYTNFYKRQINRMFPMTSSIVAFCQPYLRNMGISYSDAELAYITLFLGDFVETEEPALQLLLISDEHTALVKWIVSEIDRLMGTSVQIVNTIPRYVFEENNALFLKAIDVVLTTEQININHNQDVIFIQSLFGKAEQDFLQSLLHDYLTQAKRRKLREMENIAIGQDHFIQIPEKLIELDDCVRYLLEQVGSQEALDDDVMDNHFIPNDTKIAHVSFMMNHPGKSKIIIGKLPKRMTYRNKSIHMIIISLFYKNDDAFARSYYHCIRFLMDPAQRSLLGKAKNYPDFKKIF